MYHCWRLFAFYPFHQWITVNDKIVPGERQENIWRYGIAVLVFSIRHNPFSERDHTTQTAVGQFQMFRMTKGGRGIARGFPDGHAELVKFQNCSKSLSGTFPPIRKA